MITSRALVAGLAALLCLQLSGCAVLRSLQFSRTVDPARITAFQLDGRINLRVAKEAFPGKVRWQHRADSEELWFYTPLGSAVAQLHQDAAGAVLITSDGQTHRSDDLRRLTYAVLGWDLPLEQLPFWVRGLAGPGEAQLEQDAEGRPTAIRQAGWLVSYLDWTPAGLRGLPSKLDLQGERLRLRLAVDAWKVLDE